MTYNELIECSGCALSNSLEATLAQQLNTNVRTVRTMELADLIKVTSEVQRALVSKIMLRDEYFKPDDLAAIKALCLAVYEEHAACKTADLRQYGVSCKCGAYYNPNLRVSDIHGLNTARLWGKE